MIRDFNPNEAWFIKLGAAGRWEKECIEKLNTLRFGFDEARHDLCCEGKWEEVREALKKAGYKKVTDAIRQIQCFYKSDETVLWITFYADRLWWCFSERPQLSGESKTRKVIGQWQSADLKGKPLYMSQLSGRLLRVQRFQGTICAIKELPYLTQKIKGDPRPDVVAAEKALTTLERDIAVVIQSLTPKDFETLIDLIFRQAGWQRASVLGETLKTLDLELFSPITSARYGVQIKSEANLESFEKYRADFEDMQGFECFFFAVHSPSSQLAQVEQTQKVKLLLPRQIAQLTVKYGLADWVIAKAG